MMEWLWQTKMRDSRIGYSTQSNNNTTAPKLSWNKRNVTLLLFLFFTDFSTLSTMTMSRKSTSIGTDTSSLISPTSSSYLMVNANQIMQPTATGEQVEESNEASIPSTTEGGEDIPSAAKAPSEEEAVAVADESSAESNLNESTESSADVDCDADTPTDTATDETSSDSTEEAAVPSSDESTSQTPDTSESSESQPTTQEEATVPPPPPVQTGPLIDLFGEQLLSITMVDQTHAQFNTHYTNEVLSDKQVIGLYFSADWYDWKHDFYFTLPHRGTYTHLNSFLFHIPYILEPWHFAIQKVWTMSVRRNSILYYCTTM